MRLEGDLLYISGYTISMTPMERHYNALWHARYVTLVDDRSKVGKIIVGYPQRDPMLVGVKWYDRLLGWPPSPFSVRPPDQCFPVDAFAVMTDEEIAMFVLSQPK